jgi:hypothetical protein
MKDELDFTRHMDYIRCNPVKPGLALAGCMKPDGVMLGTLRSRT